MSREMRNSGIPWIGDIPKDWTVCFIKQIMRNKSIKGYPDERVLSLYRDYGVVPKDSRDDNHNVTSEDTSSYKFVEVGDFVINKMKAWQGSMAVSDYQGIISPAYYICRFITNEIDRKYIHYLLRNDTYKAEYMRLSSGMRVGQWDLNIDDFLRIKMVLPSLTEQQKIAFFLDRKCAEIDEMITLQERIVDELKAYKQSVITEAVTKGLNPDVPMKGSGIDWIDYVPQHWQIRKMKSLIDLKSGSNLTSMDISDKEDGYLVYGGNGVRGTYGDYSHEGEYVLIGRQGALCGNINYASGKFWVTEHALVCYPKEKCVLKWLGESLRAMDLNQYSLSAAQPGLSAERIRNIYMIVPPITEQNDIAEYLDAKCTEIDNLISIKLSKIDSLKEYKKSIIYEYVTGKKEVTE